MQFRFTAAGLFFLLVAVPARAEEKRKDPPKPVATYEIPYKLTDSKHVMVRIKLNGKGPFNFILDTGAPALIMTEAVAKKAGADLDKKGWSKFKLDVEGGLNVPDAKGITMDMFQLKGMNAMGLAGVELHGVVGYNILAKFRIQYDFTADKLVWTALDFEPPPLKRLGDGEKGGQGGLEFIGTMMKFLAPLMGLKPNFELKPRGFVGLELEEKKGGVFVVAVVKDSPADKAGIKVGDQIGRSDDDIEDVMKVVRKRGEGDKIILEITRDNKTQKHTIELGKGL
jgi:serine protease DegQ